MQAHVCPASHQTDTRLSLTGIKEESCPHLSCGIIPNTQKCEHYTDAADQGEQEMCQKRKTVITRERVIMETIISAWADL